MESQGNSQYSSTDLYMQSGSSEEADEGWVSWAWSFVPAIVGTEEKREDDLYQQRETGGTTNSPQQHTPKDPIVSIGFYCTKASVTFKVNQQLKKISTASSLSLRNLTWGLEYILAYTGWVTIFSMCKVVSLPWQEEKHDELYVKYQMEMTKYGYYFRQDL